MDNTSFAHQRAILRDLLLILAGGAGVLLLTSLDGIGFSTLPYGGPKVFFAWFGPWLTLLTGSLAILIWMTLNRSWRDVSFDEKSALLFGYAGVVWACLTAFVLEVSDFLNLAHFVTAALGVALLLGYVEYRRRRSKPQELFP